MNYNYIDYTKEYDRVMQFNKNKKIPFHRWYPFVEGYSKEFIQSILLEVNKTDIVCLEPFSGSGTTALELQNRGIKCISFEVNPLMYLISKVKLTKNYDLNEIYVYLDFIKLVRKEIDIDDVDSDFKTLYEAQGKDKWNFNKEVAIAIEKLKEAILLIADEKYNDLFMVGLASILLDVSNMYRNGKCLSYKKNWKDRVLDEQYVYKKFDEKIVTEFIADISSNKIRSKVNNFDFLYNADCRQGISEKVEDNSIDLIITSPPYLNSRDYTDTYILELKALGFTGSLEAVKSLREQTFRSHVQVKWEDNTSIDNEKLSETLDRLEKSSIGKTMWNSSILDMVRLYFVDMEIIFNLFYQKMRENGLIYFNVSNSAYFGEIINTIEICASIAENIGFEVLEIREARYLNTSPQQQDKIKKLLEAVIVLKKRGDVHV